VVNGLIQDVVIQIGHTITITNQTVNFNGKITVLGTLSLVRTSGFGPLTGIIMNSGSELIIKTGGQLTSGNGFAAALNFISIGSNPFAYTIFDGTTVTGPVAINEGDGVLPVELISFKANLAGEVVEISWATASETDNDYFTLEKSNDGKSWFNISEVTGAGTSNIKIVYYFTDNNPFPGLSYYRLKQTDYDGQFEYFTPVVVLYEPDNLFKIYPNPTADILKISTSSDLSEAAIFVKNLRGQSQRIDIDVASYQAILNVSPLPKGVYILEIVFQNNVLSKRFIKN